MRNVIAVVALIAATLSTAGAKAEDNAYIYPISMEASNPNNRPNWYVPLNQREHAAWVAGQTWIAVDGYDYATNGSTAVRLCYRPWNAGSILPGSPPVGAECGQWRYSSAAEVTTQAQDNAYVGHYTITLDIPDDIEAFHYVYLEVQAYIGTGSSPNQRVYGATIWY